MQVIRDAINERSTREIAVPYLDEAGAALVDAVVQTLVATTRDLASNTKIRDAQSVLNANGGVLSGGAFTLLLSQADTQVIGTAPLQPRLLTLDLVTTGGKRITEEIAYTVRAMQDIT